MTQVPVFVRVRPLNAREQAEGAQNAWLLGEDSLHCTLPKKDQTNFCVNRVFGNEAMTEDVFDSTSKGIVSHALRGYSGTIFAYGQTSSGKTHTMMGNGGYKGIVQLSLAYLWDEIEGDSEADYIIRCLSLEVYNERLSDLKTNAELRITEEKGKDPVLMSMQDGKQLQPVVVSSAREASQEITSAMDRRQVARTNMSEASSRSHTIFRIQIDRMPKEGENTRSLLQMVDLAGAESMKNTGTDGVRAQEGGNINKSLSALVRVIHSLTSPGRQHIPFRDSKLTRLLRTSLGGNTKTAIICCVTGASSQYDQTVSTLRFAQEAAKVKNDPKRCVIGEGQIPPALRRTLQMMAEAQTAEAREQHKAEVAKLMEDMEQFRQEQERHKSEIQKQLNFEREKRVAAENALVEQGSRKRASTGETPAPKRARLQVEVDRLTQELCESKTELEATTTTHKEQIADLHGKISEHDGHRDEIARLERAYAGVQEEVAQKEAMYVASCEARQTAMKEAEVAQEAMKALQGEMEHLAAQLKEKTLSLEEAQSEGLALKAEYARLEELSLQHQQAAARSADAATKAADANNALQAEMLDINTHKKLLQNEARHFEGEYKRVQEQLESSMNGSTQTKSKMDNKFAVKQKEMNDLKDENAQLVKKVQYLEADKDVLKKKLQSGAPMTKRPAPKRALPKAKPTPKTAPPPEDDAMQVDPVDECRARYELELAAMRELYSAQMATMQEEHTTALSAVDEKHKVEISTKDTEIAKVVAEMAAEKQRPKTTGDAQLALEDKEERIDRLQERLNKANKQKAEANTKLEEFQDARETEMAAYKRKLRKEFDSSVRKRSDQQVAEIRARESAMIGASKTFAVAP